MRCCRGWGEGVKVDELGAETEHGLVQHVIKLDNRPQLHPFVNPKLTRNAKIEQYEARPLPGVTWQVSGLSDCRQGKVIEN